MKQHLPPRTAPTRDDMTTVDLLRPISARVLPRSAYVTNFGDTRPELHAQAEAARCHKRPKGTPHKG